MDGTDGGNSDIEGKECEVFHESFVRAMIDKSIEDSNIHVEEINGEGITFVISDKGVLEKGHQIILKEKVYRPFDDWVVPMRKEPGNAEPDFDYVDNAGRWNSFIFRPVYKNTWKKGKKLNISISSMSYKQDVFQFL